MRTLRQLQEDFKNYIVEHDPSIKSAIVQPLRDSANSRLKIYGRAYFLRLREVLSLDYPVINARLGEKAFTQLCQRYLEAHPPSHFSVGVVGKHLPDFLKEDSIYSDKLYLSDLARFEWALQAVLEKPDAPTASLETLQHIPAEQWADLRFVVHPSVERLKFEWNVFDLWRGMTEEVPPKRRRPKAVEQRFFVWQCDHAAYYCLATPEEDDFLAALMTGETFENLCDQFCEDESQANEVALFAIGLLQRWLNAGMIAQISNE